jgi:hypothetical protein
MNTNGCFYPRWERKGAVSRFLIGPEFSFYEIKELKLIGGSLFVASALDTMELIGQFESEKNAEQACTRDFAQRKKAGEAYRRAAGD